MTTWQNAGQTAVAGTSSASSASAQSAVTLCLHARDGFQAYLDPCDYYTAGEQLALNASGMLGFYDDLGTWSLGKTGVTGSLRFYSIISTFTPFRRVAAGNATFALGLQSSPLLFVFPDAAKALASIRYGTLPIDAEGNVADFAFWR